MESKVIKNDVRVYYTIKTNNGLYVSSRKMVGMSTTAVENVELSSKKAAHIFKLEEAKAVASFVNGTVTKNTRHELITVTTENLEEL